MNRIAELRKEKHLTQMALAIKLNVTQNMISFYESEKNEPSINTLIKMSEIFGVSVDYIIGNSNIPYKAEAIFADTTTSEAELLQIFKTLNNNEKQQAIGVIKGIKYIS